MKKVSLVVLGLAMVTSASLSANAIELKTPGLTAVKTHATVQSTKTDKNAANEKYQKEYHAKIKEQQAALNAVKAQDKAAKLTLADVILPKEKVNEIKALTGEEFDNALNTELVSTLSAETFIQDYADFSETKKAAYYNAVKEIQAVDNRYKNVSNQLTAPLKAIVDGDVSAISSKDELKNAGAMILGIKKNLGTSSDVKKAINKVNKMNNITVVVDDKDRVVYPENGVVGSINSSLEEINNTVAKANLVLGGTLYTQEQQKTLAAIKNNKDLSEEEKSKELKAKAKEFFESNQADGTTKKLYESLSAAEKEKFNNAAADVIGAVASYGALGMQCTKLGFNISKNPLLAAPLAFELGALKDTAGLIKDSSSSLAKSVSQLKKVMKDNGITVTNTASAQNTGVKATGLKNLKPVSLKK